MLPPVRALHGPTIRELQAAIRSVREASLLAVEAAQAWRIEEMKSVSRAGAARGKGKRNRGDAHSLTSTVAAQEVGGCGIENEAWGWKETDALQRSKSNDAGAAITATNIAISPPGEEAQRLRGVVRIPAVEQEEGPAVALETRDFCNIGVDDDKLPIFLWHPLVVRSGSGATLGGHEATRPQGHRLNNRGDPERVGVSANGRAESVATAPTKNHGSSRLVPTDAGRNSQATPQTDTHNNINNANTSDNSDAIVATGVNYLAGMASDTDFIGTDGSAILDLFPPDAKLYRNPFVLGHNLDDTLTLFTASSPRRGSDGAGGERSTERRGSARRESATATGQARLDTSRVRLAAAIIVAEDAREQGLMDFGDGDGVEARLEGHDGVGVSEGEEAGNDQHFDQLQSGSALLQRSTSFTGRSKKRKGVGISFKDDGECAEEGNERHGGGDLPSIK